MSTVIENLNGDASYDPSRYELLKTIDDPAQVRSLDRRQLGQLADELRAYVLEAVSKTGLAENHPESASSPPAATTSPAAGVTPAPETKPSAKPASPENRGATRWCVPAR